MWLVSHTSHPHLASLRKHQRQSESQLWAVTTDDLPLSPGCQQVVWHPASFNKGRFISLHNRSILFCQTGLACWRVTCQGSVTPRQAGVQWEWRLSYFHCQWASCKASCLVTRVRLCCHSRFTTRASVWVACKANQKNEQHTPAMFDKLCLLQPHTQTYKNILTFLCVTRAPVRNSKMVSCQVTMFLSPSGESDETELPPSLSRESDKPQVPSWTRTTISPHVFLMWTHVVRKTEPASYQSQNPALDLVHTAK